MNAIFARFARRTSLAAALCLGAGLAGAASPQAAQPLPGQELNGRTLYQFLLAEIAGARGQIGLSTQLYLELARSTRDPRIDLEWRVRASIAWRTQKSGISELTSPAMSMKRVL